MLPAIVGGASAIALARQIVVDGVQIVNALRPLLSSVEDPALKTDLFTRLKKVENQISDLQAGISSPDNSILSTESGTDNIPISYANEMLSRIFDVILTIFGPSSYGFLIPYLNDDGRSVLERYNTTHGLDREETWCLILAQFNNQSYSAEAAQFFSSLCVLLNSSLDDRYDQAKADEGKAKDGRYIIPGELLEIFPDASKLFSKNEMLGALRSNVAKFISNVEWKSDFFKTKSPADSETMSLSSTYTSMTKQPKAFSKMFVTKTQPTKTYKRNG